MVDNKRVLILSFAIVGAILAALILDARLGASQPLASGNYDPPTRLPLPETGGIDTEPDASSGGGTDELQVMSGHGPEQAKNAYAAVLARLPFAPHLPSSLPQGMVLYHVDSNLTGETKAASFGAYYIQQTPSGRIDLHTFQTQEKIPEQANPAAQANWAEVKSLIIGSNEWMYHLLVYPQPDGTSLRVHHISRTFKDGIYVSFDVKGGASEDMLQLLTAVASQIK